MIFAVTLSVPWVAREISGLDSIAEKFRGYIHTYVSFNLTVRIAKGLAIWHFFLYYEENMRFPSLITMSNLQARNFRSTLHRR